MTGKIDHGTAYQAVRVTLFRGGFRAFLGSPNHV